MGLRRGATGDHAPEMDPGHPYVQPSNSPSRPGPLHDHPMRPEAARHGPAVHNASERWMIVQFMTKSWKRVIHRNRTIITARAPKPRRFEASPPLAPRAQKPP